MRDGGRRDEDGEGGREEKDRERGENDASTAPKQFFKEKLVI
jgi:hypothetical protein